MPEYGDLVELDRFDLTAGDAVEFSTWFYGWKRRWLAGARVRVVISVDNARARVLADDEAPQPSYLPAGGAQLALELEDNPDVS